MDSEKLDKVTKDFLFESDLNKESKAEMYDAIIDYVDLIKKEETNKNLTVELETQYNFIVGAVVCCAYLTLIYMFFMLLVKK